MASKATTIVLLCEDKQHERFARTFLRKRGVESRRIRSLIHNGNGDAKQWICAQFPNELKAYRAQANHLNNLLIVVTDVDNRTVQERAETLNQACRDCGLPIRRDGERVMFVLPKWAIETWILALAGRAINEGERIDSRHKSEAQGITPKMAEKLFGLCTHHMELPDQPSLNAACVEFQRIIQSL